jgi:copper(I)-binding protein
MHLMLLDMTMPLEAGTKVTLALRFAGAGAVEVEAPAIDAHAGAPPPRTKPVVRF